MYNKIVSSQWIKSAFLLGVAGMLGYTTWTAVHKATGDPILSWLSLFLFDIGAFCSYRMYVGDAEGAPQRTVAKWLMWLDAGLAAAMAGGALELLPAVSIRYIVWISAGVNLFALYSYETHTPALLLQFQAQDEQDLQAQAAQRNRRELFNHSMRQADANIRRQAPAMGALMALRAQAELKYQMNLPMTQDELAAWNEDVIDAEALPRPAELPAPARGGLSFWDFLSRTFGRARHTERPGTPSPQDAPSPSDEPTPPQP
jgi:hypothetical protein